MVSSQIPAASLFWLDFPSPDVAKVPVTRFPTALLLPFSPQQSPDVCFDLFPRIQVKFADAEMQLMDEELPGCQRALRVC